MPFNIIRFVRRELLLAKPKEKILLGIILSNLGFGSTLTDFNSLLCRFNCTGLNNLR